jgi:hypothetical protein
VSRRLLIVTTLPIAVLAIMRVAFLILALWNLNPFWSWVPLNLGEAAALRDGGEVARLLESGADPNATYRIRRGFVHDDASQMTPLEAARAARRDEIVQILLDAGAQPR